MATSATKAATGRVGVFARLQRFVKGTWSELKKVHWPTREELRAYTGVVVLAVAVMMFILWVLDSVFSFLLGLVL